MMTASEKKIQQDIVRHLRGMGAWVCMVHGSPYQQAGVPDLLVGYQGRFYALEVKRPGRPLTTIQAKVVDAIHAAGCVAGRVESVEDAARLMEEG